MAAGYCRRGNKWWTLAGCAWARSCCCCWDITIVNVALPDIQRALTSSFSDLQWSWMLRADPGRIRCIRGSLADMYGRRLIS